MKIMKINKIIYENLSLLLLIAVVAKISPFFHRFKLLILMKI